VGACAATAPAARAQDAQLAGVMRWTDRIDRDWPLCGAWLYPVGDSLDLERVPPDGTPAYVILRGVSYGGNGSGVHQGVDLANHRARGVVRAAASGVVVCTDRVGAADYGLHVVLAHRDETGAIVQRVRAPARQVDPCACQACRRASDRSRRAHRQRHDRSSALRDPHLTTSPRAGS
jgi:hypothetical protein